MSGRTQLALGRLRLSGGRRLAGERLGLRLGSRLAGGWPRVGGGRLTTGGLRAQSSRHGRSRAELTGPGWRGALTLRWVRRMLLATLGAWSQR
ncbi:MAG TPA: hypothetical protein VK735_30185 [Pseudonocardia sp.]|uniref:hypothetical protein n=1 Tax=Pseudonocardia sp. TaxID=60912 RepID=UPI002CB9C57B|nr:hypothetical protein [Pseudonocardia sp.]HTF51735.1 hypothetical protein [Pseudonocardia sp.]